MKRNDRTDRNKLVLDNKMVRELSPGELVQGVGGTELVTTVPISGIGGGGSTINC